LRYARIREHQNRCNGAHSSLTSRVASIHIPLISPKRRSRVLHKRSFSCWRFFFQSCVDRRTYERKKFFFSKRRHREKKKHFGSSMSYYKCCRTKRSCIPAIVTTSIANARLHTAVGVSAAPLCFVSVAIITIMCVVSGGDGADGQSCVSDFQRALVVVVNGVSALCFLMLFIDFYRSSDTRGQVPPTVTTIADIISGGDGGEAGNPTVSATVVANVSLPRSPTSNNDTAATSRIGNAPWRRVDFVVSTGTVIGCRGAGELAVSLAAIFNAIESVSATIAHILMYYCASGCAGESICIANSPVLNACQWIDHVRALYALILLGALCFTSAVDVDGGHVIQQPSTHYQRRGCTYQCRGCNYQRCGCNYQCRGCNYQCRGCDCRSLRKRRVRHYSVHTHSPPPPPSPLQLPISMSLHQSLSPLPPPSETPLHQLSPPIHTVPGVGPEHTPLSATAIRIITVRERRPNDAMCT
jgi:hypothetical protein